MKEVNLTELEEKLSDVEQRARAARVFIRRYIQSKEIITLDSGQETEAMTKLDGMSVGIKDAFDSASAVFKTEVLIERDRIWAEE